MALAGYNHNATLLPAGGGPIQPMSGGGTVPIHFDPRVSLIHQAAGDIHSYRGGFMNEPIQLIPNTSQSLSGGAFTPTGLKAVDGTLTDNSVEVTWANFDPKGTYGGQAIPRTIPEEGKPVPAIVKKPIIDTNKKVAIFNNLAPNTKYTIEIWVGISTKSKDTVDITTLPKQPAEEKPKNNEEKQKNGEEKQKNSEESNITLFGTTLKISNPKNRKSDNFTPDQLTALQKFGLDGPGLTVEEKFNVIQALYDGKCNTDQPMIFMQNCEPIRQIVQALALNLLEKLDTKQVEDTEIDKNVTVKYDPTPDGGMNVCLTFKSDQLSLLSKYSTKKNVKKNNKVSPTASTAITPAAPVIPAAPVTPAAVSGSTQPPENSIDITDLTQHTVQANKMAVMWTAKSDATYAAKAEGGGSTIDGKITTEQNDKKRIAYFNDLTPNTEYKITVTATKGTDTKTGEISIKTPEAGPIDTPPPVSTSLSEPIITETNHTDTTIVASFSKALKNDGTVNAEVEYTVSIKKGTNNATANGATSESKNSDDGKTLIYTFSNLKPDTKYTIEVVATKGTQTATGKLDVTTNTTAPVISENNSPINSILPGSIYVTESPDSSLQVMWDNNTRTDIDYTVSATPKDGGDTINGDIQFDNDHLDFGKWADIKDIAPNTTYTITVTLSKGNKKEEATTEFITAAAPPTDDNVIKPMLMIQKLSPNSFKVRWFKSQSNATYTMTAIKEATNNEEETEINPTKTDEIVRIAQSADFENMKPGTYKITVKAQLGEKEETSDKTIELTKENNNGSTEYSTATSLSNGSSNETTNENNNVRIVINPEYKKCKLTTDELNTKFPIISDSVSNNQGSEFKEMEIPDDGWCLYMSALRSLNGEFTTGGSAYTDLPKTINDVAQYLIENEGELGELYTSGKMSAVNEQNKVTYQTQPTNTGRQDIETLEEYSKYLKTPREFRDVTIPADAYVRCKLETNGNTKEYFVFEEDEEVKYVPVFQGPLVWPDLQIIGTALSHSLGEPLFVFKKDDTTGQLKKTNDFISDNNPGTKGIYLLYNGTNHYSALIPKFEGIPASYLKKNNVPAVALPAPVAPAENYKPSNNNLAARKKLAENAATVATKKAANYTPSNNNLEGRKKIAENAAAAASKKAANDAKRAERKAAKNTPNVNLTGTTLFGENNNNNFEPLPEPSIESEAPGNTPKKYTKQDIVGFQQKINKLSRNLQGNQRTSRTSNRAKTIRNIASNKKSLNNIKGKTSNVIRNTISKIKEKYKDVNRQGRLASFVGGKKKTFKKANLQKKRSTMKKRK